MDQGDFAIPDAGIAVSPSSGRPLLSCTVDFGQGWLACLKLACHPPLARSSGFEAYLGFASFDLHQRLTCWFASVNLPQARVPAPDTS